MSETVSLLAIRAPKPRRAARPSPHPAGNCSGRPGHCQLRAPQEGRPDLGHRGALATAGRLRPRATRVPVPPYGVTPYKGKNKPEPQKPPNRALAKLHAPGEHANAQLKAWGILRKLRRYSWRADQPAKAILVLQAHEANAG